VRPQKREVLWGRVWARVHGLRDEVGAGRRDGCLFPCAYRAHRLQLREIVVLHARAGPRACGEDVDIDLGHWPAQIKHRPWAPYQCDRRLLRVHRMVSSAAFQETKPLTTARPYLPQYRMHTVSMRGKPAALIIRCRHVRFGPHQFVESLFSSLVS